MKKAVVIALAVVGALALVCAGAVMLAASWFSRHGGPPEGVTVAVACPGQVRSGEEFEVVIAVTDTSGSARTIKDVDFWGNLPEGMTLVSVDPAMRSSDPAGGFMTYTMEAPVPANGTATLKFRFVAGATGVYGGDVDVSVDHFLSAHTSEVSLVVTPGK